MIKGTIKFNEPRDVENFVRLVSKISPDVDVIKGSIHLDGKSFEGIISLTIGDELECRIHSDKAHCEKILSEISPYVIGEFA